MSDGEKPDLQFKLISVAFKEAALDSPTFRASVNFLDSQLDHTQRWFLALFASFAKIPKQLANFSSVISILDFMVPSFLQDGVLDQEYVVELLRESRDSLKAIWTQAISAFQVNMPYLDTMNRELVERMAVYTSLREAFLVCQEKYDRFYANYMGTSKVRDAEWLVEHSVALANIRKDYMKVSLDLVVEISQLSHFINEKLVTLSFEMWKNKVGRQKPSPFTPGSDIWTHVLRTKAFYDLDSLALKNLSKDLMAAKHNVEVHTIESLQPSTNPSDYRSSLVNRKVLADTEEASVEKMGYVCMKTWAPHAPGKALWVRRWAFLQKGILGFLVLSPDMKSVQETDKFGLLLCNVRYCANEDRQFCFEVKTKDTSFTLQAESLGELKSWLKVFENAKNRLVDETDDMHTLLPIASGRYPPLVMELQSSVNTVTDRNITSTKLYNSQGQLITSSKLSAYLERCQEFFQRHIYDKISRVYLPFITDTTKSSIMAYGLIGSTIVPTAMSANMTGSINWGLYHIYTHERRNSGKPKSNGKVDKEQEENPNMDDYTKQIGGAGIRYPHNYPNSWMAKDYQLRALFEYTVDPSECCLVAYNCLLSPNKAQEFRATQFFTHKFFYSYVHSMGFVSMCKVPIELFVTATCTAHKHFDDLLLTLVGGKFRIKLFLDDGVLVEKKLTYLFNTIASGNSDIVSLINSLVGVDKLHARQLSESPHGHVRNSPEAVGHDKREIVPPEIQENGVPLETYVAETPKRETLDFCPMSSEFTANLPPKALFHVLCGSESSIINDMFLLTHLEYDEVNFWRKPADGRYMVRENVLEYTSKAVSPGKFTVTQEVEKFIEGELFSLRISGQPFSIRYGPSITFSHRIVVRKTMGNCSNIKFFCDVRASRYSILSFFFHYLFVWFGWSFISSFKAEVSKAEKVIGRKGETPRAAYYYGKIAVQPNTTKSEPREPLVGPTFSHFVFLRFFVAFVAAQIRSSLLAVFSFVFGLFKAGGRLISMHAFLVGVIVMLTLSNVFLGGQNIREYWSNRQAGKLAEKLVSVEGSTIQRAVYLQDVQDFVQRDLTVANDSECFRVFKKKSFILNYGAGKTDDRMRQRFTEISLKRNELLVSLNMLNKFEEELASTEWRNWLVSEKVMCEELHSEGILEGELPSLDFIKKYCESCAEEFHG